MKTRTTLTVSGLFAVLLALYFLYPPSPKMEGRKTSSRQGEQALPLLQNHRITWLQIQRPLKKETLTLALKHEEWFLDYPVKTRADARIVEGVIGVLQIAKKVRSLAPEGPWEDYGLKNPALKIGIEAEGLAGRQYLSMGDLSPVSDFYYARWNKDPEFFLIENHIRAALDRSLYSLREKRVFPVRLDEIIRIRAVFLRGGRMEWQREKEGWVITEPVRQIGQKVAKDLEESVFQAVGGLFAQSFLDQDTRNAAQLGFSSRSPRLELKDKSGKTMIFRRGGKAGSDSYYGQVEGEKIFFKISEASCDRVFALFETSQQKKPELSLEEKKKFETLYHAPLES